MIERASFAPQRPQPWAGSLGLIERRGVPSPVPHTEVVLRFLGPGWQPEGLPLCHQNPSLNFAGPRTLTMRVGNQLPRTAGSHEEPAMAAVFPIAARRTAFAQKRSWRRSFSMHKSKLSSRPGAKSVRLACGSNAFPLNPLQCVCAESAAWVCLSVSVCECGVRVGMRACARASNRGIRGVG